MEGLHGRVLGGALAVWLQGSWQARLHATCRKRGSSFDTAPPQESEALAQERNTIRVFEEAVAPQEPAALQSSNIPAPSEHPAPSVPLVPVRVHEIHV